MKKFIVLLILLVSSSVWAYTPTDIPTMNNNSWMLITPTTRVTPPGRYICAAFLCTGATDNNITPTGRSFSGGAFGADRYMFFGGGHTSYPGNDVELYNPTTNIFSQSYAPEGLTSDCFDSGGTIHPYVHNYCAIADGGGTFDITPNGRPYTEHTYNRIAWNPARQKFFFAAQWSGTWEFNPANNTWVRLTDQYPNYPSSTNIIVQTTMYSPDLNTMLFFNTGANHGIWKYDFSVNTWSYFNNWMPVNSDTTCQYGAGYDPIRHKYLFSCGSVMYWYDPLAPVQNQSAWSVAFDVSTCKSGLPSCPPSGAYGATSMDFDTVNNVMVILPYDNVNNGHIYVLHENNSWEDLTPGNLGGLPVWECSPQCQQFKSFFYDSSRQVFWFLPQNFVGGGGTGGSSSLYVYRYNKVGTTRTVCHKGCGYTNPQSAIAAAQDNDIITIDYDGGTPYTGSTACAWVQAQNVTVRGINGRPIIDLSANCQSSSSSGTAWQSGSVSTGPGGVNDPASTIGKNVIIDNIEFSNYPCGGNCRVMVFSNFGTITIRNVYIHDSSATGILIPGYTYAPRDRRPVTALIENSMFVNNGGASGQDHNIYVGEIEQLTFQYNYSRMANVGHLLKVRAHLSYILYNRITDENDATDDSSSQIDIAQGGRHYVIGNIIRKANESDSGQTISFDTNPDTVNCPSCLATDCDATHLLYGRKICSNGSWWTEDGTQELYLMNNTIDLSGLIAGGPSGRSSARAVHFSGGNGNLYPAIVVAKNNIIYGPTSTSMPGGVIGFWDNHSGTETFTFTHNDCFNVTDSGGMCDLFFNPIFTSICTPPCTAPLTSNYNFAIGSQAINAGIDPGTYVNYNTVPDRQYVHPASSIARIPVGGVIDLGALEFSSGDSTPPVINLASPVIITYPANSGSYNNGSVTTVNLSGTASDNAGLALTNPIRWVNNRGGSGNASGSNNWSISGIVLQSGSNLITVTAYDTSNNTSHFDLAVTYTPVGGTIAVNVGSGKTFNCGTGKACTVGSQ